MLYNITYDDPENFKPILKVMLSAVKWPIEFKNFSVIFLTYIYIYIENFSPDTKYLLTNYNLTLIHHFTHM